MKVAFNGTALLSPLTGIGQYAYHLAGGLRQQPDLDLMLFYADRFGRDLASGAPPIVGRARQLVRSVMPKAYEINRWLQQRKFDKGVRKERFDLYHEPNFMAFRFDGPSVVTVHDLSWIRYPHTHPAQRVAAMNKFFEPGLRAASLVLTDSEFVRREVMEVFGIAQDRIQPIALGLDGAFKPMAAAQTQALLARLQLTHGSYFLSVGTMEPRKNLETTVQAYAQLPDALRARYPLVMAGMKGWRTTSLEKILAPLVSKGQVRALGYLERSDLATVTAGALAMVYPSLYEGFGLPPLEAMGCGVPAITSLGSSQPQVVRATRRTRAPHAPSALAEAMRTLAQAPQMRAELSTRAVERAARFTWEQCVRETAAAYRRVLNNSR